MWCVWHTGVSGFAAAARQIVGKPDSYAFGRGGSVSIVQAFPAKAAHRWLRQTVKQLCATADERNAGVWPQAH